MTKKEFRDLVISSLVRNEPTEENGEMIEPTEKIDAEKSKEIVFKAIISKINTCLTYKNSLLSLCLLSVLKDI